MTTLLEARRLVGGYGKIVAVREIDLDLQAGEVTAVLGPNGAGKTTLMMTLAGLLPRISGDVLLDGQPLPSGKPNVANLAGVVLVPDNRALFTTLTVRENIEIARLTGQEHRVDEVIDLFPRLHDRLNLKAGALSGGEQQMLAMARGIVQNPKVFLIDEMSMGLAPIIVERLLPVVRHIADSGAAVVLVEQHISLALEVADQAVVLVHGDVALRGSAAELRTDPSRLERAYLGEGATTHA